jgi:hypothetical protein
MDLEETEICNDCAGEHQQQFNRPRQAVCKQSSVSTSQQYWLVASEGQTRLGVNGQGSRPWGSVRQSAARMDVNTEAEASTALRAISRRLMVKTQVKKKA